MSINSLITDADNGQKAQVLKKDGYQGLHVITNELKNYENKSVFFTNSTYGFNMNVNASTTSTTGAAFDERVHNGEDDSLWIASEISGSWDFNSSTEAVSGSYSIRATSTTDGDTAQFAKGDTLQLDDYSAFQGWIYITYWYDGPDQEVQVYGWSVTGSSIVGNRVNIGDYVNTQNQDVWQKFVIPLSDMGLTDADIQAIRITTVDVGFGASPNYYLDEMKFIYEGNGDIKGPLTYNIKPPFGVNWYVMGLGIAIAGPYSSTVSNGTMPDIPWEGLLGASMDVGTIYQRYRKGDIQFSITIKHLIEILNQFDAKITSYGSDGTDTWLKIDISFREPFLLASSYEDEIRFIFNDDLSSLDFLRIVADCREVDV